LYYSLKRRFFNTTTRAGSTATAGALKAGMLATTGTPETAESQQQQDTNNSRTNSRRDFNSYSNSRASSKEGTTGTLGVQTTSGWM
jgi:hypothetical protein